MKSITVAISVSCFVLALTLVATAVISPGDKIVSSGKMEEINSGNTPQLEDVIREKRQYGTLFGGYGFQRNPGYLQGYPQSIYNQGYQGYNQGQGYQGSQFGQGYPVTNNYQGQGYQGIGLGYGYQGTLGYGNGYSAIGVNGLPYGYQSDGRGGQIYVGGKK